MTPAVENGGMHLPQDTLLAKMLGDESGERVYNIVETVRGWRLLGIAAAVSYACAFLSLAVFTKWAPGWLGGVLLVAGLPAPLYRASLLNLTVLWKRCNFDFFYFIFLLAVSMVAQFELFQYDARSVVAVAFFVALLLVLLTTHTSYQIDPHPGNFNAFAAMLVWSGTVSALLLFGVIPVTNSTWEIARIPTALYGYESSAFGVFLSAQVAVFAFSFKGIFFGLVHPTSINGAEARLRRPTKVARPDDETVKA